MLDSELRRTRALREAAARDARFRAGGVSSSAVPGLAGAHLAGGKAGRGHDDKENNLPGKGKADSELREAVPVKRDFFGRVVAEVLGGEDAASGPLQERDANAGQQQQQQRRPGSARGAAKPAKVWVTFHEGLNNAVRKPLSLEELLRGL